MHALAALTGVVQVPDAACGPAKDASALCRSLYRLTGNEFLSRSSDAFVVRPAKILLVLVGALLVTKFARRTLTRFVAGLAGERVQRGLLSLREHAPGVASPAGGQPTARSLQRAETMGNLLRSIVTVAVWIIAVVTILGELGVDLGPFLAGAGIAGIALGFGAQHMVRDFLSGMFMLIEDQFGVGDVIDVGPASGVVESISLRSTRLRDVEGTVWHVPNGTIARVANKSQQWSRALLDIEVAYATDTDHAESVIQQVADDLWRDPQWSADILGRPEVWGVENLGADGVTIRLVVKTRPLSQWNVARQLRARLKSAFEGVGIEIPFPQRAVWHRDAPAADDQERPAERQRTAG
ncbi:MAG: mechanosensitive ion channel family protein [Actinomycetota bacterium]|nr:mechanosensitive ion channel family protein [Actinomycetota bacterium]